MIVKRIIQVLGLVAVLCAVIPLLPINIWWINIFDYPLIEFSLITFTILLLYLFFFNKRSVVDYMYVIALTTLFIVQLVKVMPYTVLAEQKLGNSSKNAKTRIKIFEANVLQKNNATKKLIEQVKKEDPDVLLFTETNKEWQRSINEAIGAAYDYKVQVPQDNTYGMLLYSKFELKNAKVNYRVEGKIPSINTHLVLPNGHTIVLYAIHPTPPNPQHKSSSSDRGKEMTKTALALIDQKKPIIVLGDFNEVAWSQNVTLFQEISGLRDVRKGRGFYNTFDAEYFYMRWPLDQIFASAHFRVEEIKKGDYMGSDHFPFAATLTYEPERAAEQNPHPVSENVKQLLKKHAEEQKRKTGKRVEK